MALLSSLIGACVGAAWLTPIATARYIVVGNFYYTYTYELGAAATLAVLAATSALRLREPAQWLTFLAGAIAGMTLSMTYLRPENAFVPTFVGWLTTTVVAVTVLATGPDLVRIFVSFLGFAPTSSSPPSSTDPSPGAPATPTASAIPPYPPPAAPPTSVASSPPRYPPPAASATPPAASSHPHQPPTPPSS